MIITEIILDGETWRATITNEKGLNVHIEGCETKAIAKHQAKDRIKELKKAGLL